MDVSMMAMAAELSWLLSQACKHRLELLQRSGSAQLLVLVMAPNTCATSAQGS